MGIGVGHKTTPKILNKSLRNSEFPRGAALPGPPPLHTEPVPGLDPGKRAKSSQGTDDAHFLRFRHFVVRQHMQTRRKQPRITGQDRPQAWNNQ